MIGKIIKEQRIKKGLTQKDLAEKLFVTPQAISRWENEEVEPSITVVNELSKIFEVSVDELLGNEVKNVEPQVITEIKYVRDEPTKPVLGICEHCNKPIYEAENLIRFTHFRTTKIHCKECDTSIKEAELKENIEKGKNAKTKSFITSGIISGIILLLIIIVSNGEISSILGGLVFALIIFTFSSCIILNNNIVRELFVTVATWGFVKFPGIIFELSIDGFLLMLATKVLFFFLGIILVIITTLLATFLSLILSIFVYPFAIVKAIKHPELYDK